jgi:hypothetical protein
VEASDFQIALLNILLAEAMQLIIFLGSFALACWLVITCSASNSQGISKGVKHVLPFKTIIPLTWHPNPSLGPQTRFANSLSTPAPSRL